MVARPSVALLLALALLTLLLVPTTASAGSLEHAYGFVVDLRLEYPLKLVGIHAISEELALGVATDGRYDYLVVLKIGSPYAPAEAIQVYPVLGKVTHVSTNGWPIERVAVGTSAGEVLVLRPEGGRLNKLLDLVLGADFFVKKVVVMRTPASSYVYAVLVDEVGFSQSCASCSVYLFSERERGLVRMGLSAGNATLSFEGLMVSDVAARQVFGKDYVYYDASYLMVAAIERPRLLRIDVNVTYYDHASQELKPASGVLLWVYAYGPNKSYTFSTNADASGKASVYVERGMTAVISALDLAGRNSTISVDTSLLPEHVDSISVSITMYYAPLTSPAATGTPPYMMARLFVFNASNVPLSMAERGRVRVQQPSGVIVDLQLSYHARGLSVARAEGMAQDVLAYYDPDSRSVVLWRLWEGSPPMAASFVTDYVGYSGALKALVVTPDGRHVICLTEDARVRVYEVKERVSEGYSLIELYRAGSYLMDSRLAGSSQRALYVETPEGVHLLILGYPLRPLLRQGLSLGYSPTEALDADVTNDGNTLLVLLDGNRLQVFRNLSRAYGEVPVKLEDTVAGFLKVAVNARREDFGFLKVEVRTPWGETFLALDENGEATLKNVLPNVSYVVRLVPEVSYISPVEVALTPPGYGNYSLVIVAPYVSYVVRLLLVDPFSGAPVAPVDVYVDGKRVGASVKESSLELSVLHGPHVVSVRPSQGYEHVYEEAELAVAVTEEKVYEVLLTRKTYALSLRVFDELAGTLLGPIEVVVRGEAGTAGRVVRPGDQVIGLVLPYGSYEVEARPLGEATEVYRAIVRRILLEEHASFDLSVPRREYEVKLRLIDPAFGVLAGSFDVYVNGTVLLKNVTDEALLRLVYGTYMLQLVPTERYRVAYEPSKNITVTVRENTEIQFRLYRRAYGIEVRVQEKAGRPVEGAELTFYSEEAGRVVATILTDANGKARVSLPYGRYVLVVSREGYLGEAQPILIEADGSLTLVLEPTLKTAVLRTLRTALPYALVVLAVALGAYGAVRLRKAIRRRLETEEVF